MYTETVELSGMILWNLVLQENLKPLWTHENE